MLEQHPARTRASPAMRAAWHNASMNAPTLREEIAHAAARMIAEDGLDYSTAKRKAVKQLLGQAPIPRGDVMPDNTLVEDAVREYQALYLGDTQPLRLRHLREQAVVLMQWLEPFRPMLTGAVWNGTAGEYSEIVLQCFADSGKDLAIFLLNEGINYQVEERPDFRGRGLVEALYFVWRNEDVVLVVYDHDAMRGALRGGARGQERGDWRAVEQRIAEAAAADSS